MAAAEVAGMGSHGSVLLLPLDLMAEGGREGMVQALVFASGPEPAASCLWVQLSEVAVPPLRTAEQDCAFALPAVGAVLLSLSDLWEEEGQDRQQFARQLLCGCEQ